MVDSLTKCFCGRSKTEQPEFVHEIADSEWVTDAPKDDEAAINLLAARGLIQALESEWPEPDEGWLDRIVIGQLSRKPKKNVMPGDYLGLMLLSTETPVCAVTGEKPRATGVEGSFLWTKWMATYADLKVDALHLLPLNGDSTTPIETLDLGKLNAPPAVMQLGADGEFAMMLDFGTQIDEIVCSGKEQALRWSNGVKAALLQTMAHSASELDSTVLVEELQKYDRQGEQRHIDAAHHGQHKLITDFAMSQHDDPDTTWNPFNQKGNVLDWHSPLHAKVKTLLDSKEHEVDIQALLDTLSRVAVLPRVLVTAAVRREPPRTDILDFWKDEFHIRFCASLETLWNERVKEMSCSELSAFADAISQYKSWLSSVYIEDPSLHEAVLETAEVYGRRTYPCLVSLAQNVAEIATVQRRSPDGTGAYGTSAPTDLLMFLGGVSEVALEGPEEMRQTAGHVVEGALYKYARCMKKRLQDIEISGNVGLYCMHCAALLTDAQDFADRIHSLLGELSTDKKISNGVFDSAEQRFRDATQVYCEKIVSITLQKTGAIKEFGSPPVASNVWATDLQRLVRDVLMPAMSHVQDMLDEPWRSRCACHLVARVVALELSILLYNQNGAPPPSIAKLSTMLQAHATELKAAAAVWVSQDFLKEAETRANTLGDVSAILACDASKLELIIQGVRNQHGGAFTQDLARKVLELRPELTEEQRSKACAKAAPGDPAKKSNARRSFLAVEEMTVAQVQSASGSPFEWLGDRAWVTNLMANTDDGPAWSDDWIKEGERGLEAEALAASDPNARSKSEKKKVVQDDAPNIDDFLADIDLSDSGSDDEQKASVDGGAEAKRRPSTISGGSGGASPKRSRRPSLISASSGGESPSPRRGRVEWKSESEWMSEVSFMPGDDEDDEDETVRGYLWKQAVVMGEDPNACEEKAEGWAGKILNSAQGALSKLSGGWQKRYFVVTQDMRQHHTLCWYKEINDLVAQGSLFLSEIGKIEKAEDKNHKLRYILRLQILDIEGKEADIFELRTEYEGEQDLWYKKLHVMLERQLAAFDMVAERKDIVYRIPPALKIRDPDRMGLASRKKMLGKAAAAIKLQKLGSSGGGLKALAEKASAPRASIAFSMPNASATDGAPLASNAVAVS